MIFAALAEASRKGELILCEDGLCRWHLRKDGVVVVREILVSPWRWGEGIGRKMIEMVREKNPDSPLVAKCPTSYESNLFWRAMGFRETARAEKLVEWRLDPPSSGAATVTLPTVEPPSPPAGGTASGSPPAAC